MFIQLQTAYSAVVKTGLLSPIPLMALFQLGWAWLRFGGSLYTLAAWSARRFPDRVALVEGERQVSFEQLLKQANHISQTLLIHQPKTIAILGRNSSAYVECLLACGRLGVDTILLNTLFDGEQLRDFFNQTKTDVLLCDEEFDGVVTQALEGRAKPQIYTIQNVPPNKPSGSISRRNGTLMLLTSGTTGSAKLVRRRPALSEILGVVRGLLEALQPKAGDATLLTIPLLHGHGLATLALCLAMGSPLYLFRKAKPQDYLQCIETHSIQVLVLVPTVLYRLMDAIEPHHNAQSLRNIVCGSAPLDATLATRALERFGPVLFNLYGSSEAGIISLATPDDLAQAPASVGRVLTGIKLEIIATQPGQPESIHIQRGGARVNTGDIGYIDSNKRLFLLGRSDDMLIVGGENVFPQVLESRIQASLGYIQECAVVGIPSAEYGQAVHLFAVVQLGEFSSDRIARDLEALLPRSLRPQKITLLEELPQNLIGKIQRFRLKGDS